MPRTSQAFTLPVSPDVAIDLVRRLCLERGWPIERLTDQEVIAGVAFTTKKASVVLTLTPDTLGSSVQMDGHVAGIGPVLRRMLQEKLEAFQASLIHEASRTLPARPATPR